MYRHWMNPMKYVAIWDGLLLTHLWQGLGEWAFNKQNLHWKNLNRAFIKQKLYWKNLNRAFIEQKLHWKNLYNHSIEPVKPVGISPEWSTRKITDYAGQKHMKFVDIWDVLCLITKPLCASILVVILLYFRKILSICCWTYPKISIGLCKGLVLFLFKYISISESDGINLCSFQNK